MARGDKKSYTPAQQHKAEKIEERYESRGVAPQEAKARAWATVNKQDGGGARSGSGRGKTIAAKQAARKDSAKRAVATRQGHSPNKGSARQSKSKAG